MGQWLFKQAQVHLRDGNMSANYRISTLSNGLRVATAEMPQMTSASVGIWVGVGSRYEPARLNGICHFIEHLLFKGTKRRTAREISEAVEGIGGSLNAFTSEEVTCFHARASADRFPDLLEVLADMLLNSRFAPMEIRKERQVIKEEIAMYLDEPQHQVQELLNATMWPGQPLGRPITGTAKSLDSIERKHLTAWLAENYTAGNIIIVAAGRVQHDDTVKAVRRIAKQFNRRHELRHEPARPAQKAPRLQLQTKDTEQAQLAVGIRTCSRHDERRYAIRLLNVLLGENMSSRLFQIIREDLGLAYSIYSTPSFFQDAGDIGISAGLDTANMEKALRLIVRELRRLGERGPDKGELFRAREYVFGQIELGQESTESQMNWVGEQLIGYGAVWTPEETRAKLALVTARQISSAARDFFRPENMNLALVAPLKRTSAAIDKLSRALSS